jgi:hypothetical protein
MGFLTGMFDKSVFTKDSYKAAIGESSNGYAVVRIKANAPRFSEKENNEPEIIGVFDPTEGRMQFNIEANWTDMGQTASSVFPTFSQGVKSAYELANPLANLAGIADVGAIWASRKIYQKSGYLTLKIPMMVVDWKGIGQPLMSAMLLSYYTLPKDTGIDAKSIEDASGKLIEGGIEMLKEKLNTIKNEKIKETLVNSIDGAVNSIEGIYTGTKNILKEALDKSSSNEIIGTAARNLTDKLSDAVTLRSSPVPIDVAIGKYFHHSDMIIESLSYEFSSESTKAGPLFAKFNLQLSTRHILGKMEDVGIKLINEKSRWKELGKNLT